MRTCFRYLHNIYIYTIQLHTSIGHVMASLDLNLKCNWQSISKDAAIPLYGLKIADAGIHPFF